MPQAENATIQLDFVPHDVLTLPGRLGIVSGTLADSADLLTPQEIETLSEQFLVDTLVLLGADEREMTEVKRSTDECTIMLSNVSLDSTSTDTFDPRDLAAGIDDLREQLENGLTVAISNCPASIESHLFTACLLVSTGVNPRTAASVTGLDADEDEREYEILMEFAASSNEGPVSLLDRCEAHFRDGGKRYHRFPDKPLIEVHLTGRSGTYACYVAAHEDTCQVIAVASAPVRVPAERRGEVCEYACRVNFNRRLGCLEMDMSDGEVRFRTGIDVEGGELTETMMKNLMASVFCGMDKHLPTLISVAFAGKSAEEALASMRSDDSRGDTYWSSG